MRFVKDRFFSVLFNFTSSRAWVYLSLIFTIWVMNYLRINGENVLNTELWFVLLIMLFLGVPLFFNLKYFREIPENMSREQYDDWKKVESFIVPDKFHIPPYWLGVIGACAVIVGLAVVSENFVFLTFVPSILMISFFAWVFAKSLKERKEKSISIAEIKNASAEYESDMEARYGIHYRKWSWAVYLWGIFGVIGVFFNFYFLIVYLSVFVFLGTKVKQEKKTIEYFE